MKKLSILICHMPKRADLLNRLLQILNTQLSDEVEVLIDYTLGILVGEKRNRLLQAATGEYLCFIDDDDYVSKDYIAQIFKGIEKGVDCCSLNGIITENGRNPLVFQHSIKYKEYKTNETVLAGVKYERYPNHLNAVKSSIAKQFTFKNISHGEDTDFATQMRDAGVLKTEHWIEDVIYYYDYRSKK